MNNKEKIIHDFNNYLYGQKAMTELCLELLEQKNLTQLKVALTDLQQQQEQRVDALIECLKALSV